MIIYDAFLKRYDTLLKGHDAFLICKHGKCVTILHLTDIDNNKKKVNEKESKKR